MTRRSNVVSSPNDDNGKMMERTYSSGSQRRPSNFASLLYVSLCARLPFSNSLVCLLRETRFEVVDRYARRRDFILSHIVSIHVHSSRET